MGFTHPRFQGDRGDWLVREDADVEPPLGAQILLRGDPAGLDGLGADPAALRGLEPVVAEDHAVAAGGFTFYTSSLAFSVLDSLWHQRHRSRPRYTCLD